MTSLPISTVVTCPTVRTHPAVIAQAAGTARAQCDGGFVLGVGSGEALNEHVTGEPWPPADVRLEMLEEAVEVIRELHTGEEVTHTAGRTTTSRTPGSTPWARTRFRSTCPGSVRRRRGWRAGSATGSAR